MKCPKCNRVTREPEDERGSHPCPYCGCDPTLRGKALDAAEDIVRAFRDGDTEDALAAIEEGLPVLEAFLEQET
jgi:hypothetical protein